MRFTVELSDEVGEMLTFICDQNERKKVQMIRTLIRNCYMRLTCKQKSPTEIPTCNQGHTESHISVIDARTHVRDGSSGSLFSSASLGSQIAREGNGDSQWLEYIRPETAEEREYISRGMRAWPPSGELSKIGPIDAARILRTAFGAYKETNPVEIVDDIKDDLDVLLAGKRKRINAAEIKKYVRGRARQHARNAWEADEKRAERIKKAAEQGLDITPSEDDDPLTPFSEQGGTR